MQELIKILKKICFQFSQHLQTFHKDCFSKKEKISENTDDLYYDDDELFDMFDSEHTKEVILSLYEDGMLEKFGIKNLGYNKYKDYTFELLEDIIYLSNDLGYGSYALFVRSQDMAELKKCKYNMLEEYYKDVSEERYNFPERVKEVIKVLKETLPDILIIDNERKKKIEEHYQHCDITPFDEDEDLDIGMYHLGVAFINNGIRLTYEIIIFPDGAYIDDDYTETNYGSFEVEEKIKNALKKCQL